MAGALPIIELARSPAVEVGGRVASGSGTGRDGLLGAIETLGSGHRRQVGAGLYGGEDRMASSDSTIGTRLRRASLRRLGQPSPMTWRPAGPGSQIMSWHLRHLGAEAFPVLW